MTDVLVNGPDQVYVDRGAGLELTGLRFADDGEVRRLAQRLAASVGRRLDDAVPFVDARLADGSRVHAVLGAARRPGHLHLAPGAGADGPSRWTTACAPVAAPGRGRAAAPDRLRPGWRSWSAAERVRARPRCSAALLALVPPDERIVIVEDSRELAPDHPHVVRLEGRPANAERAGAITLTDLVRQSLRMRPDRLVVGEVRGGRSATC